MFDNSNKKWEQCLLPHVFSFIIQCHPVYWTVLTNSLITGTNHQKGKAYCFFLILWRCWEYVMEQVRKFSSFPSVSPRSFLFLSCKRECPDLYVFWGTFSWNVPHKSLILLIPVQKYTFIRTEAESRWKKKHSRARIRKIKCKISSSLHFCNSFNRAFGHGNKEGQNTLIH